MKRRILITLVIAIVAIIGATSLVGCSSEFDPTSTITVVSREDGSGTRSGFDDIVGLKDANKLTPSATILSSTGAVMTKVNTSPVAIGYISLGSYNDTVKMIKIGGVTPSGDTVKDGSYKLQRNFNIITKSGVTMSETAQDFIKFIASSKGQAVVTANHYVAITAGAEYKTAKNTLTGSLNISGSSSVSPLMQKMKDAYNLEQNAVKIIINTTDSGSGVSDVTNASGEKAENTIGMISREAKAQETAITPIRIAIDGIVVIVNNKNTAIDSLTLEQVREIYSGKITQYSKLTLA